ncbi:MAG: 30S ribosomal protein S18 [Planctomycetota bacterium]
MERRRSYNLLSTEDRINYKNIDLLQRLMTPQGKILPRRRIGCDSKTQHKIKKAIHRARYMALLRYGD